MFSDVNVDRFSTMSLASSGPCTIPSQNLAKKQSLRLGDAAGRATNRTDDIDGATPSWHAAKYANKPSFYGSKDIKGASPTKLHRQGLHPDNTLRVDDIEGARPRPYTFKTQRNVNPLVPQYKLPTAQSSEPPQPKFIRDAHNVGDIEGTRPKPLYRFAMRNNGTVDDIDGAQASWKPRHQQARLNSQPLDFNLNVSDINNNGFRYHVYGMVIKDEERYTKPKPLPAAAQHDYYSLKTRDIEGAWPGWTPPHGCQPPVEKRRHFRNTNFVGDIAGAQPDTVKHAIRTNRVVNPLNPVYDSLDGEVLVPPVEPRGLDEPPDFLRHTSHASTASAGPAVPQSDDKDRMIAKLESELASLKASSRAVPQSSRGGAMPTSARPGPGSSTARKPSTSRRPSGSVAQKREAQSLAADIAAIREL